MSASEETEGVWGHIVSLVPRSEVFEIEALIGSSLIAENATLWRELKAFNAILTELHTLEFDEPLGMTPRLSGAPLLPLPAAPTSAPLSSANLELLTTSAVSAAASGGHPVPSLSLGSVSGVNHQPQQQPHEQQQQQQQEGSLTRRSNATSVDSMEFIFAIQDRLTVDKIQGVLDEIRRALRSEKRELEAEVAMLFSAMDGEADSVAARRQNSASAVPAAQQPSGLAISDTTLSPGSPDLSRDVCRSCARVRDFASQQPGRIRKAAPAGGRDEQLCFSCLDRERQARGTSGGGGGGGEGKEMVRGSKLRSRLEAARDEHHFFD